MLKQSFSPKAILKSSIILLLLSAVASCGLKYIPTESPQTFEQNRRTAVENYVAANIGNQKTVYTSIAFGETQTVKPLSYKLLDSLYAIKYLNEKKQIIDYDLEAKIERQRLIALNDTNKVIYIEDHIFSLGTGDTIEIYSGLFQMEKDLIIDDIIITESVFLPKRYSELYKVYLFEESFMNLGNYPTGEELKFYAFFKAPLPELNKAEKDAFILHTLKIMDLAKKKYSLKTNDLLKQLTTQKFLGGSYANYTESFSTIQEQVQKDDQGKEIVTGYTLDYSYTDKSNLSTYLYRMEFDAYLRLIMYTKL